MKTTTRFRLFCVFFLSYLVFPQSLLCRDPDAENAFLWKTRIGECTVWIAGTIHVGRETHPEVPAAFLEAIRSSDRVILEIADDFVSLEGKLSDYIQKDSLPEERYFRNTLDQGSKDRIVEVMGKDKFYEYDRYNAWVLITRLSVQKMKLMGYEPSFGVDRLIREQAFREGKEIIGLETAEEQFEVLEFELPYEVQVSLLAKLAGNLRVMAEQEAVMCDAYYSGQGQKFEEIFNAGFDFNNPGEEAAYSKVFAERNSKWASTLVDLLGQSSGTFFVAVGAGHLFGPGNLLDCLREKGIRL